MDILAAVDTLDQFAEEDFDDEKSAAARLVLDSLDAAYRDLDKATAKIQRLRDRVDELEAENARLLQHCQDSDPNYDPAHADALRHSYHG